jgi:site-specific DNA-cytosine methylase
MKRFEPESLRRWFRINTFMIKLRNVVGLFDGVSCGQVALQRAGIHYDTYYASEIDKHAQVVTQKNFPDTVQLGDVTKWREWDLKDVDLIMGGSPCQGFSVAGRHLNFDDPRSALFFEFLSMIRHYKPKYFLLENVKMRQDIQDAISAELGVEPILINSNLVSAQNRKRLYWTNIPDVKLPKDQGISLESILEIPAESGITVRPKSKCVRVGGRQAYDRHEWDSIDNTHSRKFTVLECERLQTLPDGYTEGISNTQRYKTLGNGWTVDVIAHIFRNIR